MLEVEIDPEEIAMISGLTLEEIKKLSKEVTIRVRETDDVVNFDLKDVLYHYDDADKNTEENNNTDK